MHYLQTTAGGFVEPSMTNWLAPQDMVSEVATGIVFPYKTLNMSKYE